jgi:chromosome segregation ATPase
MAPLLHRPRPDLAKSPSVPTPARTLDELDALHAALDSRLAALEAALADPNECALEGLILDLARTATEEAEAIAKRASAQARAEADTQTGNAVSQAQIAEAALASERQASLELHRSLGAARTELEATKQKLSALTRELEQIRDAFNIERTSLRAELSEAERCFAAADTRRQQVEVARDEEVSRERAMVERLTDALAQAKSEIDAARQDVASRAADMEAARERAELATRAQGDLNHALNEARSRVDAVSQERDRLASELEGARQTATAAAAASANALQAVTADRAALEQKWHEAEARATALMRERDGLATERNSLVAERDSLVTERNSLMTERNGLVAERDAANGQLEATRQSSTAAAAAAQAIETQRGALEQSLRDMETRHQALARERDAVMTERDAAKAKADAIVAERDAAQARRDAAEAERQAAIAQLEAARQGSSTASAAIQSLDAHRATLEQNWQHAEARAQALQIERDAAIAQRDALVAERDEAIADRAAAVATTDAIKKAVGEAAQAERARFTELRQRTERQIQDLEAELLGGASAAAEEDGPEITVSLDDVDESPEAIEIEPIVVAAAKPKGGSGAKAGQPAAPGTHSPVRAASRHCFREPLEVKLDGETALLIDLSTAGAQVLSPSPLKPNKPVKILLPSSEAIILCKAKIVWSRFEPPTPGKPVRYRAGMVFTQVDAAALQLFMTRHTGVKMATGSAQPAEEKKAGRLIPVPFNTTASGGGKRRTAEPVASIDFKFPAQGRE